MSVYVAVSSVCVALIVLTLVHCGSDADLSLDGV